jgi:hypothetical protein
VTGLPDFNIDLSDVTDRIEKRRCRRTTGKGSRLLEGPLGEQILELAEGGWKPKEIQEELGVSVEGIKSVIDRVQKKQGILLEYRAIQHLQLTELQGRILGAITSEKIAEAPLRDLVLAYKVLKDKEQVDLGKPSDIKGLVGYLIQIEKEEADGKRESGETVDLSEEEKRLAIDVTDIEDLPEL